MAYTGNTAQFYSHNDTLVREDLQDVLAVMDPVDLPLLSTFTHVPVNQRKFEWPVDTLPIHKTIASVAADTHPEGQDATFETPVRGQRIFNFAQINSRAIDVSDTSRVVDRAGPDDEFDWRLEQHLLGLGHEIEYALHYGLMDSTESDQSAVTGRATHGLIPWLAELGQARKAGSGTKTILVTAGNPVVREEFFSVWYHPEEVGGGEPAAGEEMTKAIVRDQILTPAWRNGFRVQNCLCLTGTALKAQFAYFAVVGASAGYRQTIPAEMKKLYQTIDVIEMQLGAIWVNLDRHLDIPSQSLTIDDGRYKTGGGAAYADMTIPGNRTVIFLNPDYFKVGVLRPVSHKPLAPVGDSTKALIRGEMGLIVRNPIAGCGGSNLIANAAA